jgi:hypothetical protein
MDKINVIIRIKDLSKEKKIEEIGKLVKELSKRIDSYPDSSLFLTISDAINSNSDISLIRENEEKKFDVQREFISS